MHLCSFNNATYVIKIYSVNLYTHTFPCKYICIIPHIYQYTAISNSIQPRSTYICKKYACTICINTFVCIITIILIYFKLSVVQRTNYLICTPRLYIYTYTFVTTFFNKFTHIYANSDNYQLYIYKLGKQYFCMCICHIIKIHIHIQA